MASAEDQDCWWSVRVDGVQTLGPIPLGWARLESRPGVDVFYGRNGAGKSRVLSALYEAFAPDQRRSGDAQTELHLTLVPDPDRTRQAPLVHAEGDSSDVHTALISPSTRGELHQALEPCVRSRLSSALRSTGIKADHAGAAWLDRLAAEVASSGRLIQRRNFGSGNADVPAAITYFAADPVAGSVVEELYDYAMYEHAKDGHLHLDLKSLPSDGHEALVTSLACALWADVNWNISGEEPWVTLPVVAAGVAPCPDGPDRSGIRDALTAETAFHLPASTASAFTELYLGRDVGGLPGSPQDPVWASPGELGSRGHAVRARLQDEANRLLSELLVDAPILELHVSSAIDALLIPPLEWLAGEPGSTLVPLESLSDAQRRWAEFAVAATTDSTTRTSREVTFGHIILLDEPERALHPSAQRFLASGLTSMAERLDAQLVLTTHSPVFLRHGEFRLHHVDKRDRRQLLKPLPSAFSTDTATLGVEPADLLQLTRVVLVVEGLHDEVIVKTTLAETVERCGVLVLPMRGVTKLPEVVDSAFLFDYTAANVVVLLDNGRDRDVAGLWDRVRVAARDGDLDQARELLQNGLDRRVAEESFLQQFGRRAVDTDRVDRVTIHAIEPPDVLDLLPLQEFLPAAPGDSWEELRNHPEAPKSGSKFKAWLSGFGFDPADADAIEAAARRLESLPPDLASLADALTRASLGGWHRRPRL